MNPAPTTGGCASGAAAVQPAGSTWSTRDHLGALRVRLGVDRANYRVAAGLYAIGQPAPASPVFVTANYKLSFDHLRRAVDGLDAWLLVLETNGVNVWCAAGKGTFSTAELCRQIEQTGLAQVVSHRRLILPQLGAVGVAAHEVAQATGFTVIYGPVRAEDIRAWLAAGRRKDEAMRTVRFDLRDRFVLVPVELSNAGPHLLVLLAWAAVLAVIRQRGLGIGLPPLIAGYAVGLIGPLLVSGLLVPMLLPWLPTRSFSVKGAAVGLGWAAALAAVVAGRPESWLGAAFRSGFSVAGLALTSAAIAAFVGLNFTGATTFTSQSGTLRETKAALPFIVAAAVVGLFLQVVGAILGKPL